MYHWQKIQICHFDERSEEKSQNTKIKISHFVRNDTPCLILVEHPDASGLVQVRNYKKL
jgi:hypothetical protein